MAANPHHLASSYDATICILALATTGITRVTLAREGQHNGHFSFRTFYSINTPFNR